MPDYVTLMVGSAGGDNTADLVDQVVADLSRGFPLAADPIVPAHGLVRQLAGDGFVLYFHHYGSAVDEPWVSYPFVIDLNLVDPDLDHLEIADKLYEALVGTGRYRALIVHEDVVRRATHYPLGPW
jgi:hypothetical protein